MTFLLFRQFLLQPRLLMMTGMMSMLFLTTGDFGIVLLVASTFGSAVILPHRASLFEASLPINARTILRARLMASFVYALTPLVVWLLALGFFPYVQKMQSMLPEMFGTRTLTPVDLSSFFAVAVIAATLPFCMHQR